MFLEMRRTAFVALSILVFTTRAPALEVGEKIGPVELLTFDDRPLVMNNYGDRRASVVLFLSTRCPATDSAAAAINDLNTKYRLRDFLLVGVFSNPAESGQEMRQFAQRRGFLFPFYRDPKRSAARRFGARLTPEAFLLDRFGALVYRGAVSGLEKAMSAMLGGQPVEASQVPPAGTPLEQPRSPREIEDLYGSVSYSSELIFEKIAGASAHHASTIAQAGNGDLLALWYGGSYESADDEALFLSRRKKGERAWSQPQALAGDSLQPAGNAVIFRDGAGRIWIVWGRMEASRPIRRGAGWGQCRLMYRVSSDHGMSWSEDKVFQDFLGWLPRNVPITLQSGELLLPMSGRAEGASGSFFLRTRDNGKTWERSSVITGGSQPTVAERQDGTLLTLMRRSGRILQSESSDGGRTWTPGVASELRNPGAGIAMTALRNGHFVLVFNDSERSRSPLNIARSLDGGRTWETPLALEANPGEYSYPSVIQSDDGKIHVTYTFRRYTIKHVEMDEGWLENLRRPN